MTSASFKPGSGPARRTVVAAAGAAGLTVALNACGGSDDGSAGSPRSSASSGPYGSSSLSSSTEAPGTGGSGGGDNASAGATLTTTSGIPDGGGRVFADRKVVVTQPTAGRFKAFSATCTHQGCAVKSISDGLIKCPCHNSDFSITDGGVKSGPATRALPEVRITVSGGSITLA